MGNFNASYEIPKGSGKHSMFMGSIWMSGLDNGGNLYTAGQTYRERGIDFWPGALDNQGLIDSITCKYWDRLFSVKGTDIVNSKTGGVPSESVLNWPGTDAPFNDLNFNNIYEPNQGEYPVYDPQTPGNIPGEMVWCVINDVRGAHTAYPGGLPLGMEIQITSFAYQSNTLGILNNSTLYRFKMINKSSKSFYDFKFGFFTDPDLGDGTDDYVGCNFTPNGKRVFYCYNSDFSDAVYGSTPPAVGLTYLKTLKDLNGVSLPVSSFMFITSAGQPGIDSDPRDAVELNRYLSGLWADGQPLTYGTPTGRGGVTQTSFAFPGDLNDPTSWKEEGTPGDRRMLPSISSATMQPGSVNEVVAAVVWARSESGGNTGSVAKLLQESDTLHQLYSTNFAGSSTGIESDLIETKIFPNPSTDRINIELALPYRKIYLNVLSINGAKILNEEHFNSKNFSIDVSSLANGVYFLKINADGQTKTLKFIKK